MSLLETSQPWSAAHHLWAAGYRQLPALPGVHRFCLLWWAFAWLRWDFVRFQCGFDRFLVKRAWASYIKDSLFIYLHRGKKQQS